MVLLLDANYADDAKSICSIVPPELESVEEDDELSQQREQHKEA